MDGDLGLTEDEMLAQAIAMSLNNFLSQASTSEQASATVLPSRADSSDSALCTHPSQSGAQQLGPTSQETTSSVSSSPDLGISASGDADNSQGNSEDTDASQSSTGVGIRSTTAPPDIVNESTPCGRQPGDLPYARLSSLHDVQNSLDKTVAESLCSIPTWQPNKECLELIIGMGISENATRRALYYTGNNDAEMAIAWVFENINDPDLHMEFNPPSALGSSSLEGQFGSPESIYHSSDKFGQQGVGKDICKMVFVVNCELRMGVGKVAAQVGHATLGLYRYLLGQKERQKDLNAWEDWGAMKIVLKGDNSHHLNSLKKTAFELGISSIMVHDAGRTQVEAGSLTVLALFGRPEQLDKVTGNLKLL